jgi:hypothetical protein
MELKWITSYIGDFEDIMLDNYPLTPNKIDDILAYKQRYGIKTLLSSWKEMAMKFQPKVDYADVEILDLDFSNDKKEMENSESIENIDILNNEIDIIEPSNIDIKEDKEDWVLEITPYPEWLSELVNKDQSYSDHTITHKKLSLIDIYQKLLLEGKSEEEIKERLKEEMERKVTTRYNAHSSYSSNMKVTNHTVYDRNTGKQTNKSEKNNTLKNVDVLDDIDDIDELFEDPSFSNRKHPTHIKVNVKNHNTKKLDRIDYINRMYGLCRSNNMSKTKRKLARKNFDLFFQKLSVEGDVPPQEIPALVIYFTIHDN